MFPSKEELHKYIYFLTLRLVRHCKEFISKRKISSVKLFAYAKFGYRKVSNFNNTKLEKLPNVKILKLELSTFELSCVFCQY